MLQRRRWEGLDAVVGGGGGRGRWGGAYQSDPDDYSGYIFGLNANYYTWIILGIVKQHSVQIGRIDGPTGYLSRLNRTSASSVCVGGGFRTVGGGGVGTVGGEGGEDDGSGGGVRTDQSQEPSFPANRSH